MGTVNYKTSSRICTVGYDTHTSGYDIEELMQEYQCTKEYAEERAAELEEFDTEETYQNVKHYLGELPKMEHYSVAIENGYYEGFCILVSLDCDILYKEVNEPIVDLVNTFLDECIKESGFGCDFGHAVKLEMERKLDQFALLRAWIEDRLNGIHGIPGQNGYGRSRAKKIRKALGYTL